MAVATVVAAGIALVTVTAAATATTSSIAFAVANPSAAAHAISTAITAASVRRCGAVQVLGRRRLSMHASHLRRAAVEEQLLHD
jgi:hypothetical protein